MLVSGPDSLCRSSPQETYSEVAIRATQLKKVFVARAHDEFVNMDIAAVAESDRQVRVLRLVEQVFELDVVVELHGRRRRVLLWVQSCCKFWEM